MRLRHLSFALCGGLLFASCRTVSADADRRDVLATLEGFFDWIETGEPERATATTLPNAAFANFRRENGEFVVRHFTMAESLARRSGETRSLREAIVGEPTVLIEGDLATVWCSYTFHVNGKLSHTGIDSFSMFRTPAGWRIAAGAYSVVNPEP